MTNNIDKDIQEYEDFINNIIAGTVIKENEKDMVEELKAEIIEALKNKSGVAEGLTIIPGSGVRNASLFLDSTASGGDKYEFYSCPADPSSGIFSPAFGVYNKSRELRGEHWLSCFVLALYKGVMDVKSARVTGLLPPTQDNDAVTLKYLKDEIAKLKAEIEELKRNKS